MRQPIAKGRRLQRLAGAPSTIAILAVLWAGGVAGIEADGSHVFTVSIRFDIDRSIDSRVVVRDVQDEAASLWRPYGVRLDWSGGRPSDSDTNGYSLDAIVERRIGGRHAELTSILGQASVSVATVPPRPILVSFDATERVLSLRKTTHDSSFKIVHSQDLSRALGRVLAHEIGHVLLHAPYHDDVGLMRPVFRADDLAEPDRTSFRLACPSVARLRSRIESLTDGSPITLTVSDHPASFERSGRDGFEPAPCIPGRTGR